MVINHLISSNTKVEKVNQLITFKAACDLEYLPMRMLRVIPVITKYYETGA